MLLVVSKATYFSNLNNFNSEKSTTYNDDRVTRSKSQNISTRDNARTNFLYATLDIFYDIKASNRPIIWRCCLLSPESWSVV